MKTYFIYCFLALFIWEIPTVKDTSRYEAQAETGRVYRDNNSLQIEKHALKKRQKTNTSQTYFRPADDGDSGIAATFTIALTWVALGWWALVGTPTLGTLLVLNFIGVLLAFLFLSGSIKPPRIRYARNAIGAIVAGVANAAAQAATGCALVAVAVLSLLVLILSSIIILSNGWVLLIVLGGVAFVGAIIAFLNN
ncbi:hypothetical protein BKI52_16285 [marine bacterium AO1-C]|nr:hypothetical protein BKI52_16285 [marine bacterium AO1-C]